MKKTDALRRGIEFIAFNDEPLDREPENIQHYVSVITLAEALEEKPWVLAQKIARLRKKEQRRKIMEKYGKKT